MNEYTKMVNTNRKFEIGDLIKFVVEHWEKGYFISFSDAVNFICNFAYHCNINVDREQVRDAWADYNNCGK